MNVFEILRKEHGVHCYWYPEDNLKSVEGIILKNQGNYSVTLPFPQSLDRKELNKLSMASLNELMGTLIINAVADLK